MKTPQILKQVLQEISLSKEEIEELKILAKDFTKKISNSKVGGSLAKNTLIKKPIQDIDIFVEFNSEEKTKQLEKILKKAKFKTKKIHGSRDYFQIKKQNTILEIVPVVKTKSMKDVENVTDFSVKHVNYIKKQINKNKKLADEIKLAKVFCYANNFYGAESYIKGFSGYALELLVCYFNGFINFLKQIQKKKIIDPKKHFKNEREILQEVNQSKLQSPVILIDPIYKYRNACAGLSNETFEKFLQTTKKFLQKPGKNFFEKKEFSVEKTKKQAKKSKAVFLEIKLETEKQEGDIAGTKMKKFFLFLIKELERKQQKILNSQFIYSGEGQEAKAYLTIKPEKQIQIKGPPLSNKDALKKFKKVRKKIIKKSGFAWANEKINIKQILNKSKKTAYEMGLSFVGFKED